MTVQSPMKAISLWQPWATLIALGAKTIETRSWQTSYRGPIAIHAAKRLTGRRGEVLELGEYSIERDAAGLLLRGPIAHPYRLPLGAVVATATLVDCVPMRRMPENRRIDASPSLWLDSDVAFLLHRDPARTGSVRHQTPYGHFEPGRWAWILDDIDPIKQPVPARGRQGLWNLDVELAA